MENKTETYEQLKTNEEMTNELLEEFEEVGFNENDIKIQDFEDFTNDLYNDGDGF